MMNCKGNVYKSLLCALGIMVSVSAFSQTVSVTTPEELIAAVSTPNTNIRIAEDLLFDGLSDLKEIPFVTGHGIVMESDPSGPIRTITLLDMAKFTGIFADDVTIRNLRFVANDSAVPAGEEPFQPGFFIALFGNTQNDNSNSPGNDPSVIENVVIENCVFTGFGGSSEPGAIARIDLDAVSITFRRCFLDYTGGQAVLRYGQFGGQPDKAGKLVIDQCTLAGYPVDSPNQPFVVSLQSLADSNGPGVEVEITNSILIPGGNIDPAAGTAPFGPVACWGHGDKLLSFREQYNLLITASGNFGGGNPLVEKAPDSTDIINQDPLFTDIIIRNFKLASGSPAFGKGKGGINIGADQSSSTGVWIWESY